jgi:hypothetical protein
MDAVAVLKILVGTIMGIRAARTTARTTARKR